MPPPAESSGRVTYPQLRVAASYDPTAFRAFWKINGMVCPPEQIYTAPEVMARTRETLARFGTAPPVAQPTHEQLLAALRPAGAIRSRGGLALPDLAQVGADQPVRDHR